MQLRLGALLAALVVGALSLATSAAAADTSSCPPPGFDTVPDFDIAAYANGSWYAQKQIPIVYQPKNELYCVKATYKLIDPNKPSEGLNVYNYANRGAVNGQAEGAGFAMVALPVSKSDGGSRPLLRLMRMMADGGSSGSSGNASTAASKLRVGPKQAGSIPMPEAAFGPYWVVAVGPSSDPTLKYDWALVTGGPPTHKTSSGRCSTFNPMLPTTTQYRGGLWILTRKPVDPDAAAKAQAKAEDLGLDTSQLVPVQQEGCQYKGSV